MRKSVLSLALLAIVCVLPAMVALAQTRVFVAAQGSDANPCTFAAPCRTFQHAHDVVAANGEIDVLDPAGYGALTITKAISIQGHGFSGVSVGNGAVGITINGASTDDVHLNGLLIEGSGIGGDGIVFHSGQSLTIENCIVRNLANNGVTFNPSGTSRLAVSSTVVANTAFHGIAVQSTGSGTVTAALSRVEAYNHPGSGILIYGGFATGGSITAVATDSVASGNGSGFSVGGGSAPSILTVVHSVSANNDIGIFAKGVATLRVAGSTVIDNPSSGWSIQNGANIESFGDNNIKGNGANTGALTSVGKQ